MHRIDPAFRGGAEGRALLILRVVVGPVMAMHAWHRIHDQGLTNWGYRLGIPPAVQACAALAEFGGGIAWTLGALTPVAALGVIAAMGAALSTVEAKYHDPIAGDFVSEPTVEFGGVELALGILILFVGPGRLSVDALLFDNKPAVKPEPPRDLLD